MLVVMVRTHVGVKPRSSEARRGARRWGFQTSKLSHI